MFDAVTLAAVVDELNSTIVQGRVQEIVQLDALTFGFEIYAQHARRYLYGTVHSEDARVHLVKEKLRGSGEAPSSMLLLLRKYGEGALVNAAVQLPHERVVKIELDHSTEGLTTLVIETIGRYSNLILVDAGGVVIDSLKRVGPAMNRARVTLPKHAYVPPPSQDKIDPTLLSEQELREILGENQGARLSQVLVQNIAGTSPLLAREIAFRVADDVEADADPAQAEQVHTVLHELIRPPWKPCTAFKDGEIEEYAPYPLEQYPQVKPFDSISEAIESYYGQIESYAAAKEPIRRQLAEARDRLARKRDALASSIPSPEEIKRLRTSGEWVLAYAYQIKAGQALLKVDTGEGTREISLDPKLGAVENANKYFKEYHRVKDAAERVPPLLNAANAEVEYAEQMLNDLEEAENRAELDAVVQAARQEGLLTITRPRARLVENKPRTIESRDGFTILVGRNARENEELTFQKARADDLWLHARNVAGAHVIVVRGGRDVPESTIREAAQIAARHSQAREQKWAEVIIAPRKNVHRMRGAKKRAGLVTVRGEQVLQVELD